MAQATTNSYAAEGATNPYLAGSSLSDAIWQPVGALNPNPPPGSIHFLPYEPSDRALYHETTVAGTYSHIAAPSTAPLAPQRHTRIAYDDTIIYPSYTPLLEEEGPAQQRRTEGEPAYQASTPSKEALQDAGSIQVQEHGERLMQRSFGRSLAVDTGREEALAENKGAEEVVIRPRGFPSHSPISSDAPGVSAAIDNSVHELTARMLAPSPPSSESSAESLAPRHARRISLVDLKPFKRAAPAQQRKSTLIITRKSMTAESLGPKGGVVIGGQSRQPSAATATTTSSTSQQPLFKIRRQSVLPETAPGPSPILRPSAVAAVPPGSSAATAAATAAPAAQTHRGKVPPPPPPGAPRNHSTSAPQPQPPKAKPSVTTTATTAAAALPATAAAPATSPAPGNVRPPNAGNALPVMDKPLAEEEVKPKLMSPALSLTLQGTSWRDGGDDKEAEEAEDTAESEDNWIGLPKQLMDSEEGDTSDHNEKEDEYNILMSGWLVKCNKNFRHWRKRWCVIRENALDYYSSEQDMWKDLRMNSTHYRLGHVELLGASLMRTPGPRLLRKKTPTNHLFRIMSGRRAYVFCAQNDKELAEWCAASIVAINNGVYDERMFSVLAGFEDEEEEDDEEEDVFPFDENDM